MILAMITVMQCEDCHATGILQHPSEYEQFEDTWHDGMKYQFCPTCKLRPQAEDRIAEDRAIRNRMALFGREEREVLDGFVN